MLQGADCSKSVCPVLCSSHGQYGGGICHCEEGWKGAECDIPLGDCQVPDCNQHGQCVRGSCVCNPGWKGEFCEERKSQLILSLTSKNLPSGTKALFKYKILIMVCHV